jgi:hypothetical protein
VRFLWGEIGVYGDGKYSLLAMSSVCPSISLGRILILGAEGFSAWGPKHHVQIVTRRRGVGTGGWTFGSECGATVLRECYQVPTGYELLTRLSGLCSTLRHKGFAGGPFHRCL